MIVIVRFSICEAATNLKNLQMDYLLFVILNRFNNLSLFFNVLYYKKKKKHVIVTKYEIDDTSLSPHE